jgi:hypothetical protein
VSWWLVIAIGCLYGLLLAADSSIYSATVAEVAPEGQLGSAQAGRHSRHPLRRPRCRWRRD